MFILFVVNNIPTRIVTYCLCHRDGQFWWPIDVLWRSFETAVFFYIAHLIVISGEQNALKFYTYYHSRKSSCIHIIWTHSFCLLNVRVTLNIIRIYHVYLFRWTAAFKELLEYINYFHIHTLLKTCHDSYV